MKNIKTKSYILGLFTLITLGVTYAYTSVSSSLTYLRGAGDIGHIGYIITEIFDTNAKIKSTYLPEGLVVGNASVTQTGIVKLINATGSTSEVEAPTINILTQVWNDLNTRLSTLSGDIDAIDISGKEDKITAGTTGQYYRGDKTWQTLDKTAVGLSNIDNTTDLNKPVSTATQTALNAKQAIITGGATTILTSDLSADRALVSDGSGKVGVSSVTSTELGYLSGVTSTIQTQFNTKAPLISPNFTGTPKRTTAPTDGDASNELATTARVKANTVSASSTMTFSTCSTTDKKQMFYECDPTLSACSTVGAYCGGGKVAGTYSGSIIVSALSDEGQNTWGYASSYGNMNPATQMCWEKGSFGFDDWQLPNKEELNLLYTNRTTIGGFGTSNYWSSTEVSTNTGNAWSQNFSTGTPSSVNSKTTTYLVRCLRKY